MKKIAPVATVAAVRRPRKRREVPHVHHPETPAAGPFADLAATLPLARANFFSGLVDYEKRHKVAVCRWCKGAFVRFFHHWVCENPLCQDRCGEHAITKPTILEGESPFLYLPLPLQVEIEENQTKRLLIEGPAGYGKSYGSRWMLYKRCRQYPGYRALLLRCTYDQLEKNHLQFMSAEAAALGDAIFKRGTQESKQMIFENDARTFVGYCEHDNHIGQYKGPEWDEIIFEEASEFQPKALQIIASRDRGSPTCRETMFKHGIDDGRTRLLTNPGGRSMLYLRDHFIDRTPDPERFPQYDAKHYGAISGVIEDNPYLPENFKSAGLGGLDAEHYAMYAEGRWDVFPGQFFSDWQEKRHVKNLDHLLI